MSSTSGPSSPGLHHVTAITASAAASQQFHTYVLGLRRVKLTVNFDDPGTHHLYFADHRGSPGSVLTYFPWHGVGPNRPGAGETAATVLAAPAGALGFWADRLKAHGVTSAPVTRFGREALAFTAADQTAMEITELDTDPAAFVPPLHADIPEGKRLLGFHSVALRSRRPESTVAVLRDLLGFRITATDGDRTRLSPTPAPGLFPTGHIDILPAPAGTPLARLGGGGVHHVAVRSTAADHLRFFESITAAGHRITPVQERVYFRSLYFREPGGVLLEIATDDPGFTADEPLESLGTSLKLPPWLESHRRDIEAALAKL